MLEEKIMLTPQDILEKEFKIDARGYRPQEVDKFLDIVIRDYSEFLTIIKKQDHELRNVINDNERLRAEVRNIKSNIEIASENRSKNVTNVDILQRLSELEKIVYGEE